jgi:hypothetical protein
MATLILKHALVGLTSTATRVAAGTSSRNSSSRFAANSTAKKLIPVSLPPGRARPVTRPSLTGSLPFLSCSSRSAMPRSAPYRPVRKTQSLSPTLLATTVPSANSKSSAVRIKS